MCRLLNTHRMETDQFLFMSEVSLRHHGQKERATKFFTVRGHSVCLSAAEKMVNKKALSLTNKIFPPSCLFWFFFSKIVS